MYFARTVVVGMVCAVLVAGCSGRQPRRVTVGDATSREHLGAEATMSDYIALAEISTNKMLSSKLVAGWKSKKPRIIIGRTKNTTDNENIRVIDIYDRIQEVLLNSGLVRVLDASATSFDYIIKPEITATREYGEDRAESNIFTLQLKLFTVSGELVGQWSADARLDKEGRPLV
jgi:penicillin-binding protein activator